MISRTSTLCFGRNVRNSSTMTRHETSFGTINSCPLKMISDSVLNRNESYTEPGSYRVHRLPRFFIIPYTHSMISFPPIEMPENLHSRVTRVLALQVLEAERDSRLLVFPNEAELCHQLGVSRTILREAVKVLADKGMIEARQKLGTRALTPDGVEPARSRYPGLVGGIGARFAFPARPL